MNIKNLFKMLIALEFTISLLSSVSYRALYFTINGSLISVFERYREVAFDLRSLNSPITLILGVILLAYIYYGMWTFKNHTRWLYILAMPLSTIIITYLAGTSLAHPLTVVLRNTTFLLQGAVIALCFTPPINEEFKSDCQQSATDGQAL